MGLDPKQLEDELFLLEREDYKEQNGGRQSLPIQISFRDR